MSAPELPPPAPGTDAESGVLYYVQHIVDGPQRQEATIRLKGWLTNQIIADADPGDYGALYCVWADLEDIADAFTDEAAFEAVAPDAAREWLAAHADPTERAAWVARWNAWLAGYAKTHTVHWKRPGFVPRNS